MKNILYMVALGFFVTCCNPNMNTDKASKLAEDDFGLDSSFNHKQTVNKDSCKDGIYIKYAHVYNNFITDNQGYILEKHVKFVKALESDKANDKSGMLYKELVDQTKQSLDSLDKLCAFNGNSEFKNAGIDLFKFYQQAWDEYKGIADEKDKQARIKNYDKLKDRFNETHSKTEKVLEDKFMQAHTNFSYENMLHVRTTAMHETLDSMIYLK